jgi:hypothetical protein
MSNPEEFGRALLDAMGLPVTDNNVTSMVAWQGLEGGHWRNSAKHNPLNTMRKWPGSWNAIGNGVEGYATWEDGIAATAATLKQSNMASIVAAFAADGPPSATMWAIGTNPAWGGTDYAKMRASFQHNDAYWASFARQIKAAYVDDEPFPGGSGGLIGGAAGAVGAALLVGAATAFAWLKGWVG